jgi:hypothetical protein
MRGDGDFNGVCSARDYDGTILYKALPRRGEVSFSSGKSDQVSAAGVYHKIVINLSRTARGYTRACTYGEG